MKKLFFLLLNVFWVVPFTIWADVYHFKDAYNPSEERLYIMHFGFDNKAVSTLFVGPTGKMMLFDLGRCRDDGEEIVGFVNHVLTHNSRSSLDRIIVSHNHYDHNGEKKCNGANKKTKQYLADELGFSTSDIEYPSGFSPGDTWVLDQDDHGNAVTATVIASNGYVIARSNRIYDSSDENTTSVVLLITYKDFVYYIGGDLTGGGDRADNRGSSLDLESSVGHVVNYLVGNSVDVVQVNHHGSSTSSNQNFLNSVMPKDGYFRNAIVNVNPGYTCLPIESTLDRIMEHITRDASVSGGNTHLWQTDVGGNGESGTCAAAVTSEITSNGRHSIEERNIWIRTDGTTYSIRSVAGGGHLHFYSAIPIPANSSSGTPVISLQAYNGYYIGADGQEQVVGVQEPNTNTAKSRFYLIDLGNNNVAFKTHNGYYLQALHGGNNVVNAIGRGIGAWETFTRVNLSNNQVAFRAYNGYYLRALHGGNNLLDSKGGGIGAWEKFTLVQH